jgi:hypothetical protein
MAQDAVIHGRGEAGERQVQGEGEGVDGFSQESLRGAYTSRRGIWYSYRWGRNEQAGQNSLLEELSGLQGYAPGLVFQDALCGFAMSACMGTLALAGVLRVQGVGRSQEGTPRMHFPRSADCTRGATRGVASLLARKVTVTCAQVHVPTVSPGVLDHAQPARASVERRRAPVGSNQPTRALSSIAIGNSSRNQNLSATAQRPSPHNGRQHVASPRRARRCCAGHGFVGGVWPSQPAAAVIHTARLELLVMVTHHTTARQASHRTAAMHDGHLHRAGRHFPPLRAPGPPTLPI